MIGDLALAWETSEPDRTRDLLAALRFRVGYAGRMTCPGLTIVVVRAAGLDRLRISPGDGRGAEPEDEPSGPLLLAVGVATVDLDRAAVVSGGPVRVLSGDDLLGARAAAAGGHRTLLLEPITEGRAAATLARHGEGPAALYLEVDLAALAAIRGRLLALGERPRAGNGPFGPQLLASTRHAWGPHLLLVARDPAAAGPAGDAWATIEP